MGISNSRTNVTFVREFRAVLCCTVCLFGTLFSCDFSFCQEETQSTVQTTGSTNDRLNNEVDFDPAAAFDELVATVEAKFCEPELFDDQWKRRVKDFRRRAIESKTHDDYSAAVNGLLATLNRSHTFYFSTLDPKRYQLLGVFHPMFEAPAQDESKSDAAKPANLATRSNSDLFTYAGVGIATEKTDGKSYVTSVYDGLPADKAGILFGDEIVGVDRQPFHPILSFAGKTGSSVKLNLVRDGKPMVAEVPVVLLDGRTMFEAALKNSARVIERGGKKIGYVHPWSYAGAKYHEAISEMVLWGKLSDCDALVLDLRDGWGGASPSYLNLFRKPFMEFEFISREGEPQKMTGVWGKPIALIVNRRSTSGKELFTYGFKKLKLGKVVGEKTAGAVLAGSPFLQTNGDLLYLAVSKTTVDGKVLEGVGVDPDVVVPRDLNKKLAPLTNSVRDVQFEAAVQVLLGH